jgi:hypothetical protein
VLFGQQTGRKCQHHRYYRTFVSRAGTRAPTREGDAMSEPVEIPYAEVVREVARRSLAQGVPPQEIITGLTSVAIDIFVAGSGPAAMCAWLRDVADLLERSEATLQ